MQALNRYLLAGMAYGVSRKSLDLCLNAPQVTIERDLVQGAHGRLTYVSRNRPMLVTEKLAIVATHACITMVYSPYYVATDIWRAEARARGIDIDPAKQDGHEPEFSIFDYIVS